ncbi:leucoanthocyanidin dioxygenase [Phtheirospermum japonicum]|uniref:Leucoanthocyanidin dioxygenase n=1 Tax=Phtheirospermum japonicum TaxID=374723 RepID=A0A830BGT7_9LAMI|nr:leucoanthocyanidin dioxygenase [Phtheirospermum japonicum]
MAATATQVPNNNNNPCVKVLADSCNLKSTIPSHFTFTNDPMGSTADSLPTIDFSLLTSAHPHQRSKTLDDMAKACQQWGFFVLVNHGIPETLLKAIVEGSLEFFELAEDEKRRYEAKSPSDPIKSGSGRLINTENQSVHLWRDYVKCYVHPEFHCPQQPQILRDILFEFSERTRLVARKLIHGIGEKLGLEEGYIDEALELDSSFQLFAANLYPLCPQPDQAIGIPPHTDPGLFTFLIHNGVAGLQIEHDGKWFNADSPQNSLLVNVADHLEIFSNGRCKSVKHRAVVNSERERISVVVSNGPSGEAVVSPAAPLVLKDGRSLYRPMKYTDFLESLLTKCRLNGESILEQLMIQEDQLANNN